MKYVLIASADSAVYACFSNYLKYSIYVNWAILTVCVKCANCTLILCNVLWLDGQP